MLGNYFISTRKDLNGYIDEIGVCCQPVYATTVSLFDNILVCTNQCSSGQSCYNVTNGPTCAWSSYQLEKKRKRKKRKEKK